MPQKNFLKKVFFVLIVSCLIFLVIYFWMIRNSQFIYNEPIGGWEPIKVEIEEDYEYDTDLKNAALQLGEALQEAIDDPNHALETYQNVDAALGCLDAVIEKKGLGSDEFHKMHDHVQDISTKGYLRQRRYIRYNVNLSGGSYPLFKSDVSFCKFQLEAQ
jgi:hypothetical protein